MSLLEFLLCSSFVLSVALLVSCVWKHLKSKPSSDKHYNNISVECVDINTVISSDTLEEVSPYGGSQQSQSPAPNQADHSEDNLRQVINCESLQHINKTRPKRSNIRRSTRKSKSMHSTIFEHSPERNSPTRVSPERNGLENSWLKKNNPDYSCEDRQLNGEVGLKTSMFSLRIEEVTQPLSSPLSSQSHRSVTYEEESGPHLQFQDLRQLSDDETMNKAIVQHLSPQIIAEIKSKQNQSIFD